MTFRAYALFFVLMMTTFCLSQNVPALLKNRPFVERQINCILERGPCDGIGKQIKRLLPEALNNNCQRCTSRQMRHSHTLMEFMKQNYPNEWNLMVQRYRAPSYYSFNG